LDRNNRRTPRGSGRIEGDKPLAQVGADLFSKDDRRIAIENISPQIEGGRFPQKPVSIAL